MVDSERATLVERDDVAVMFKRVADEQTAISRGWAEVEQAVGSLHRERRDDSDSGSAASS